MANLPNYLLIMIKFILLFVFITFISCKSYKDPNDLGFVERLPKGDYIIWNYGSRHLVKCIKKDGKFYWLSDKDFSKNKIPGYDAHQYRYKTHIKIN